MNSRSTMRLRTCGVSSSSQSHQAGHRIRGRFYHQRSHAKTSGTRPGAEVLRYPVSATAAEKPLPRKGQESFPSWTSPVRPRSPALFGTPWKRKGSVTFDGGRSYLATGECSRWVLGRRLELPDHLVELLGLRRVRRRSAYPMALRAFGSLWAHARADNSARVPEYRQPPSRRVDDLVCPQPRPRYRSAISHELAQSSHGGSSRSSRRGALVRRSRAVRRGSERSAP